MDDGTMIGIWHEQGWSSPQGRWSTSSMDGLHWFGGFMWTSGWKVVTDLQNIDGVATAMIIEQFGFGGVIDTSIKFSVATLDDYVSGDNSWTYDEICTLDIDWDDYSVYRHGRGMPCGIAKIGDKLRAVIPTGTTWYYYSRDSINDWSGKQITVGGYEVSNVKIVNYDEKPFIVYTNKSTPPTTNWEDLWLGEARWAMSNDDGDTWSEYGTIDPNPAPGYVSLRMIKNTPAVTYFSGGALKYAYKSRSSDRWTIVDVDPQFSNVSNGKQMYPKPFAEYQNRILIYPSVNPSRIYSSNVLPTEVVVEEAKPTYFCECNSNIFGADRLLSLNEIGRWKSSAHGYSDTRITDSPNDNVKPSIVVKSSGETVVAFEDRSEGRSNMRLSSFNVAEDSVFGSGTRSWFDTNVGKEGRNISSVLDINEFISMAYEVPISGADSMNEMPSSSIQLLNYNYSVIDDRGGVSGGIAGTSRPSCDISKYEDNIITSDPFLASQIIKQILVDKKYVDYNAYINGRLTTVVSSCDISFTILGTPEAVAIRLKNESDSKFSEWCPWQPQTSDYMITIKHRLSSQSGLKTVCAQVMTYNGVTVEFCINIVADYAKVNFEIKLYSDANRAIEMLKHNGLYVSSLPPSGATSNSRQIYLNIIPSGDIDESIDSVIYDVVQQGVRDDLGRKAVKDGQVFKGDFVIYKEDKLLNIDGIAHIKAKLPGACDDQVGVAVTSGFVRDDYNQQGRESVTTVDESSEVEQLRDESGKVGTILAIRPLNDPHFIFGDPNYYS
jgi:hypothetical protein